MRKVIVFSGLDETKGTYKYHEEGDDQLVRTLYLRKDKIGGKAPEKVFVLITDQPINE
jgi:hypothetical protein